MGPDPRVSHHLKLPDSVETSGPFRPFQSDPDWHEAPWWLGVPLALFVFLLISSNFFPDWYKSSVLPEGYGLLELFHFFVPLLGFLIGLRLLFHPAQQISRLIFFFTVFASCACFYIAGEEHSWGQHFFHWETPEIWANVNRQQETNFHNMMHLFDKKPRLLLELGIVIGGLILPFLSLFDDRIRRHHFALFFPASALVPTALGGLFFWLSGHLESYHIITSPVFRPSESAEAFYYLFLLFFLIVFAGRLDELHAQQQ